MSATRCLSLCVSVATVAVALAPLPGQQVAGRVRGFSGEDARGAVITCLDVHGGVLGQVLSDAKGRFEFDHAEWIDRLHVQEEGVVLVVPVPADAKKAIDVTFVGAKFFTLRGHVVDPDGAPARRRDLACRDADHGTIVTVTTDERGAFAVRMGTAITDVVLDPLGWKHVEEGPFDADRGLAIDLRLVRDKYFCVRGSVVDADGAPLRAARITAADGARVAWTIAGDDGRYALWANRAFAELVATDGIERIRVAGLWQASATLDLDARTHGLVLVTGRVLDRHGQPVVHAELFALDEKEPKKRVLPIGRTDESGRFHVRIPRNTKFLCGRGPEGDENAFAEGPWTGEPVELRVGR